MPRVRVLGVGRSDGSNTAREKKKANHMPYAKGRRLALLYIYRRRRVLPPEWAAQLEGGPHPGWRSLGLRAKLQHPVPSLFPVGRRDQTSGTGDAITPKWPRPYVPIPRYPSTSYPTSHIPHPADRIPRQVSGSVPTHLVGTACGMVPFSRRDDLEEQTPVPSRVFYDQKLFTGT